MNGSWHVYGAGERWRKPRALGLGSCCAAEDGVEAVQFGGPTLRVLAARALRRDPRAGPARPRHPRPRLRPRRRRSACSRGARGRELGDALLDQGMVAGIGNIFKSEACFAARLDPWRPVGELSDEELERGAARGPRG